MGVRSLRSSISMSLVLHVFFGLACLALLAQRPAQKPRQWTMVELEPFNKTERFRKETPISKRQIVQTVNGTKVEQAVKDSFLGEKNQAVDRQTVSKNRTTVMGQSNNSAKSTVKKSPEAASALSKLGIPILPQVRTQPDENDAKPQWAQLDTLPQDYVKGFKEADHTALNTKEYVFYGYFQRIRERLDRAWVPILRAKLISFYQRGRHLASDMDHTTRIMVTLNQNGEIVRVQVLDQSGTKDLDDAAINAFNQAGPFPNPPKGIVDPKGEIQIPWEFILRT